MSSKRLHFILTAIICLLLLGLVGGAYGINSMLGKESQKLAGLKAKSKALDQEQIGLKAAKKSIAKYAELEQISHAIVPEDKNQAEAVRQIANIAAANDIALASITFPASTLGNLPGGGSASSSSTATTNAPTVATKTSQLQPVPRIPGVYQLPITITSDSTHPVPYYKFINFLSALEHNRRTAQVNGITLQPDATNHNNLGFTLVLNEYIKP